MIFETLNMSGYGIYVWSSFLFTIISFVILYNVINYQLRKEQRKFNSKYSKLNSDELKLIKKQKIYEDILVFSVNTKI
tara:strand:- start:2914 stop:3147 length:234 start_codon:yes stop_codon:yes gene_type:complete